MRLGWKTITGGLGMAIGILSSPDVLALLPAQASGIVLAVSSLLGAVGIRAAIAKVEDAAAGKRPR